MNSQQIPPPAVCGRCGYQPDQHLCPGTRPRSHGIGGLVTVLTVLAIVVILFVIYRFYIDTHCTQIIGTQVCQ
jgi:hypothetical protein